jgi:flagellar secretion chaperone FliS
MSSNVYDAYLESTVLTADPVELIRILYRAALESVTNARRHLQEGDIAARSRQISKACAILTELSLSVDRSKGGVIGANLVELYDYMQKRLLQANIEQSEPPLAEVSGLLGTMLEAWMGCSATEQSWRRAPVVPIAASPEYVSQSWSL